MSDTDKALFMVHKILLAVGGHALILGIILGVPALIAFGGSLTLGAGLKVIQDKAVKELSSATAPKSLDAQAAKLHKKAKQVTLKPDKSVYDCATYDQTSFEFKLASEGVISIDDVTLCEDFACPNCLDERERRVENRRQRYQKNRRQRYQKSIADAKARQRERATKADEAKLAAMSGKDRDSVVHYQATELSFGNIEVDHLLDSAKVFKPGNPELQKCTVCDDDTYYNNLCPTHRLVKLKEQAAAARAEQKRKAAAAEKARLEQEQRDYEAGRIIKFNGITIQRPHDVPVHAEYEFKDSVHDNFAEVIWTWLDKGKIVRMRQPFVADRFEVTTFGKGTVGAWTAIYDPDTNEHLGDYRLKPDGESEIRGPQKQHYDCNCYECEQNKKLAYAKKFGDFAVEIEKFSLNNRIIMTNRELWGE